MNAYPSGGISVVARSKDLRPESVDIVVTLPTFKRPDWLLRTLESLTAQKTTRRFAVIGIENEAELREGAAAAGPVNGGAGLQAFTGDLHSRR